MTKPRVNRTLKSLIPPLQPEELEQLERSLLATGCRDALVVWRNGTDTVIDGHNRLKICTRRDIKYKIKPMRFGSLNEVKLWMIDNQMGRRNIADIDRIALQSYKEELLRPLAKANQRQSKGRGKKGLPNSANLKVDTRKECAKSAGVGRNTYDAGKMILEAEKTGEVSKKDVDAIRRKEKSIHRVAKDLKESRQKKKRAAKRKKAVKAMPKTALDNIHVGDFRKLSDVVPDGSLSLIFTDPPYDKKSVELYDGLGKFAADKLCEGGSLLLQGETTAGIKEFFRTVHDISWSHALRYLRIARDRLRDENGLTDEFTLEDMEVLQKVRDRIDATQIPPGSRTKRSVN